ncbi:MAG TPA: hypothetical protein VJI46_07805 [Candidatus Nanoarchaeia archaeon]|nr:hypothetical protein [Candidatus Nanoarchaeia archaeon]
MRRLEECIIDPSSLRERDRKLEELNSNNRQIGSVSSGFWEAVEKKLGNTHSLIRTPFCTNMEWREYIAENTSYMLLKHPESEVIYANPSPVPEKIVENYRHLVGDEYDFILLASYSYLKREVFDKLDPLLGLVERNRELLIQLCKLDLESRLGTDFQGVYPHACLDVDLPYQIGGRWLVIEPALVPGDYEGDIKDKTFFGREGLENGRIRATQSKILNQKALAREITSFVPDVVLIKVPTPGAERDQLVSFYAGFLSRPTLIVSDWELDGSGLFKIDNLVGVRGLSLLETKDIIRQGGGSQCPFERFRMYALNPQKE